MQQNYSAIILAAGKSVRFKDNKFLFNLNGKPLIEQTITPFLEVKNRINKIYVVTGAFTDELKPILNNLDIIQTHNPLYDIGGMSSSIIHGLQSMKNNYGNAIFIHPGDIPFVKPAVLRLMIDKLEESTKKIVIPTYKGQNGHPLLVHNRYAGKLLTLSESKKGLKEFLKENYDDIAYIPTNYSGILHDIDRPEDLNHLSEFLT